MKDPLRKPVGFGLDTHIAPVSLQDRFGVPPFSVLDARQGYWQTRKRAWLSLGIKSEISGKNPRCMFNGGKWVNEKSYDSQVALTHKINLVGRSIFVPVLCELTYRWFCFPKGKILDPFAGGSVRGITASVLGLEYTGIELRKEQVKANYSQWASLEKKFFMKNKPKPTWIIGDSTHVQKLVPGKYDLIFTCPPYGNLEIYSDDPADISNMKWEDFIKAYYKIITNSYEMLKNDCFAVIVVGDFRDKDGFYRTFPAYTIKTFEDVGLHLYNDGILITIVGSTSLIAGRHFAISRKLGKTHQNYLVFYKGNPKNIKKNFPEEI